MASREKSVAQFMLQNQRKKCPDPSCRWIGSTQRHFCPICDHTLTSAAGGPYANHKSQTVLRYDHKGNIIEDNRDKYPAKEIV